MAERRPQLESLCNMQAAIGPAQEEIHVPAYDAWDGLSLTYDVKWPLHILLTPEVGPVASRPDISYTRSGLTLAAALHTIPTARLDIRPIPYQPLL